MDLSIIIYGRRASKVCIPTLSEGTIRTQKPFIIGNAMRLRHSNIQKLDKTIFDVVIVGGGINGAVAGAALSAKGVKVALIDRGDFAGFTSQESSNLAWGGIKYLETFEFLLVRNLCKSRNHLIESYPSTVEEIRFFTTIAKGFRYPPFFIYLGTWFYWLIGNCFTKTPRYLRRKKIKEEETVVSIENAAGAFEYSDAYLHDNDARFVFNFIRSALNMGCIAANYVESLGSNFGNDGIWSTKARDVVSGNRFDIRAKVLINTCGPFVDEYNKLSNQQTPHHHVFSKGIHLIVDRITPNKRILTFFADDGRLFFVIPMGPKTCIGTTDNWVESPFTEVTDEDRKFVLDNVNKRLDLEKPLTKQDIIAERSGVRPLAITGELDVNSDWISLSRKHAVDVNRDQKHISVFGGKLTDCLNVGEEIVGLVKKMGIDLPFPDHKWYGEPHEAVKEEFFHQARLMDLDGYTSPESSEKLSTRLWRRYGAQAIGLLENIREDPAQAEVLIKGAEYIRCEIQQAAKREMITKLEDFLRRRSKIALIAKTEDIKRSPGLMEACEILFGSEAKEKFDEYFETHRDN